MDLTFEQKQIIREFFDNFDGCTICGSQSVRGLKTIPAQELINRLEGMTER